MTHYELRWHSHGSEYVLVDSAYPKTWEGLGSTRPMRFATRGGAKNYKLKYGMPEAKIVRVCEERS